MLCARLFQAVRSGGFFGVGALRPSHRPKRLRSASVRWGSGGTHERRMVQQLEALWPRC